MLRTKELSSPQDKTVRQTIKDLRHSKYAHRGYISAEMPYLTTVTTPPALGALWIVQKKCMFECANIRPMPPQYSRRRNPF